MKRKLKAAVALAGALVLVLMMAGPGSVKADAAENTVVPEASWSIGVRTVPLPEGASDELRKMLKAIPAPKYQTRIQITPKDVAGWEAMQKERDERGNATAKALAKQFSVAVEREEIDGVTVYHGAHQKVGDHAARAVSSTCKAGYQWRKVEASSLFSVLTRVCRSRCAPRLVHCIDCFFTKRLLIT
jgi:hypothetical protein